jgi:1-deoxy-D-xylulose-5-phosphate synthase
VVLERIDSPAALRALPEDQLPDLAAELRQAILEAVARTGGHLGSNLGVVELTLALHRAFDSPRDILLWDTGHQAYVHKMLTGRSARFDTLRQPGGLSGYPARVESPHDVIENSHASTALSWAFGLAQGQRHLPPDERRRVVSVVGDGALTGGMAYEALNNLGHHQLPALIVLNDNGRSYAETVGRLSGRIADLRSDPRYRSWRDRLDRAVSGVPLAKRLTGAGFKGLKAAVSEAPALQSFVEALGVRYVGPFDGHDVSRLEHGLRAAARLDGPVLVHVITQKGKGYEPAETDPEMKLHDTSAFDLATGPSKKGRPASWTHTFSEALLELADERDDIVALTAAMPGSTGLLPVASRYPNRVIDVGIAEQHAVTAAAGLACAGRMPVFAVYSTFFSRAFDQANLDVGLHDEHVVYALDRAGITGPDGPSHHGVLDLALSLRIPSMTVLAPSCAEDLRELLRVAVDLSGPVSIRFPKGQVVTADELGLEGPGDGLSSRLVRAGQDVSMLAVGDRVGPALQAADLLAEDGIEAAVWDVRCVRPADQGMLDAVSDAPLVVTVENGMMAAGAGAHLADRLAERTGVRHVPAVLRLGTPDAYLPHGTPERIRSELGLDGPGIAAATRKALADER